MVYEAGLDEPVMRQADPEGAVGRMPGVISKSTGTCCVWMIKALGGTLTGTAPQTCLEPGLTLR